MKSLLVVFVIIPFCLLAQHDYLYQYHDFRNGNQTINMDFQNHNFNYPNKIPYAKKSSNVNPINLGYGFSNSMYDKNMSGAYDVIQVDSFYYIAGRTRKGAGSLTNNELMFSMKIDLQGNVVWRRTDSLVDADHWDIYYGHTLAQLDNGDFAQVALYAMYDSIDSVVNYFPLISKFNKTGSLISKFVMNYDSLSNWVDSTTFTPMGGVISEPKGGLTLIGQVTSKTWVWRSDLNCYLWDSLYLCIIQIDSNFNIATRKYNIADFGKDILIYDGFKTSDNGYIVTLKARIRNGEDFIIKLDSNLNYSWHTKVGDSLLEYWNPIKTFESKSGGYIYTREHPTEGIAYGKLSKSGNKLWEKTCQLYNDTTQPWNGIYRMPMGIIEQDNGDILFSTRINITNGAGLVRTDSLGNIKWYRWILGMYGDVGNQTHAGGMFLYNMRKPIGEGALLVGHAGYGKAQLIRTDSLGCTLPNCLDTNLHLGFKEFEEIQKQDLILYPNPAIDRIQIAINQQGEKVNQVIIYDINGREILNKSYNEYLVNIDVSNYNKGVYIVSVIGRNGAVFNKKFIKE